MCFQPSQWGLLSSGSGCSEMHDFGLVGRKPETIPCRPFLYGIYCLLQMSLYGVQGAPKKTDCQVINKECSEDVHGNTRGQLINLQSKTCHSQDTFLWLEFIRECRPNPSSEVSSEELYIRGEVEKKFMLWILLSSLHGFDNVKTQCPYGTEKPFQVIWEQISNSLKHQRFGNKFTTLISWGWLWVPS